MKIKFILILVLALSVITAGACKNTGANLTTSVPQPTPATKGKTQKEIDVQNASVKADDYEQHSGLSKKPAGICDLYAYVVDKDPAGLNVRDSASNGSVMGKIPLDEDGTIVHLISTNFDGWVQIDRAETVEGKIVFDKKGWVAANLLATSTTGYGTDGVELSESSLRSKVLATIPPETEVRMFSCEGKRPRVVYKKLTGWLAEEASCPNPVTNCS